MLSREIDALGAIWLWDKGFDFGLMPCEWPGKPLGSDWSHFSAPWSWGGRPPPVRRPGGLEGGVARGNLSLPRG